MSALLTRPWGMVSGVGHASSGASSGSSARAVPSGYTHYRRTRLRGTGSSCCFFLPNSRRRKLAHTL